MTMDNASLLATAKEVAYPNYRPAPFVLTKGRGCRVEDVEGRSFLDLSAGIAVLSVGHCHPKLAAAIAEQAARLMHVSNLFYNDRAIELAAEITRRTPFDRVYFANSGSEANEALLKLARHHHYGLGDTERVELVGTLHSFHGRTLGSLSLTGQAKYHKGMEPLLGGVKIVPYGDLDAMRAVVGDKTAAVLVEPLQAEGGLIVPPQGYLEGLRELTRERGALLLFDEVQTGYGRTGTFLAQEQYGVVPDACSLAKGIGGGFPLAAMAVTEALAGALPPGTHASTFGGNALACAAGLAVLRIIDEEGLLANCVTMGEHLAAELEKLAAKHASVVDARGRGLLRGLALADDVDPAATLGALRDRGLLVTLAAGYVLRISPALNVTRDELDEGLAIVDAVLADPPRKKS